MSVAQRTPFLYFLVRPNCGTITRVIGPISMANGCAELVRQLADQVVNRSRCRCQSLNQNQNQNRASGLSFHLVQRPPYFHQTGGGILASVAQALVPSIFSGLDTKKDCRLCPAGAHSPKTRWCCSV